jgi:hypothetical protein
LLALAAAGLLLPGCGRKTQKPAFPVRGQVLVAGRPLETGFVVFHPADKAAGAPRPSGYVKDGKFSLTTYKAGDGAPTGDYLVTVESREVPSEDKGSEVPRNRLPDRYSKPETSGLRAVVASGTNEPPAFQLSK